MTLVQWEELSEEQKRDVFESPAVQEAFGYRLIADGIEQLEEHDEELADRMVDHTHQRVGRNLKRETVQQVLDAFRAVIEERTAPIPEDAVAGMSNDADSTEF